MTSTTNGTQQDLSSILTQVKGLEEEKAKLMQMLEAERERLKEEQAKTIQLSEGKRAEMRQALDTVIMNWLQDAVKDEKVRDEFKAGMTRLAEDAKDDAGVWQVVKPPSARWTNNWSAHAPWPKSPTWTSARPLPLWSNPARI